MVSTIPSLKSSLGLSTAQPCSMAQGTACLQLPFWRGEPAYVLLLQDRDKPLLSLILLCFLLQSTNFSPSLLRCCLEQPLAGFAQQSCCKASSPCKGQERPPAHQHQSLDPNPVVLAALSPA